MLAGNANAYGIKAKFETQHYAVFEVILGRGEVYGQALKQIIAKDIASRAKFQSTAAVFPVGSKGMSGTINEKLLGIISTENYDGKTSVTVNFDDRSKLSSYVGIYMNFNRLAKIADNRTLNTLIPELAKVPLVIEKVQVETVAKDYKGDLFYVASKGSLIIDFKVVDSMYYTRKKLEEVNDKCYVNILAITDRFTRDSPFLLAGHGAVNDIVCDK